MSFPKRLIFLTFVALLLFPVLPAQAQYDCGDPIVPCGSPDMGYDHPCELCDVFVLVNNVIQFVLLCLVPPIALAMLVIGALVVMFSGGSPALQSRAKSILRSVIIGLVLIYGAWLLVNAFLTMIGVQNWTGLDEWFQPAFTCGAPGGGPPPPPPPGTGPTCGSNDGCLPGCTPPDPDCVPGPPPPPGSTCGPGGGCPPGCTSLTDPDCGPPGGP